MKNFTAISLLFIFLCANTALGQLFKLPALIQHFHLHQNDLTDEDHDISFLDFIKQHYNELNTTPDSPGHDHKKLPFKNMNFQAVNSVIVVPHHNYWEGSTPAIILVVCNPFYTQQYSSSASLSTVWQPPRFS